MYHKGILSKNQKILKEKTKNFDAIVSKSVQMTNELLIKQFESRMEKLAVEIDVYEKKIKEQEMIIHNLETQSISGIITKEELLRDRKIAQSVIREVIKSVEVDETTGEITINTY